MVRKNKKLGFSLVEALVSMAILSIFFLATTKIITMKPNKEKTIAPHGSYYCCNDICTFTPPSGVSFFNIYTKNSFKQTYATYEPNITESVTIYANYGILKFTKGTSEYKIENEIKYEDFENYLELTNPQDKDDVLSCSNVVYISW